MNQYHTIYGNSWNLLPLPPPFNQSFKGTEAAPELPQEEFRKKPFSTSFPLERVLGMYLEAAIYIAKAPECLERPGGLGAGCPPPPQPPCVWSLGISNLGAP